MLADSTGYETLKIILFSLEICWYYAPNALALELMIIYLEKKMKGLRRKLLNTLYSILAELWVKQVFHMFDYTIRAFLWLDRFVNQDQYSTKRPLFSFMNELSKRVGIIL